MQKFYIDFLNNLRLVELQHVTLEYRDDITPALKRFVVLLLNVKYEEATIHCFYGEIKTIVSAFTKYWVEAMHTVDTVEKDVYTVDELSDLFNTTFDRVRFKFKVFKSEFSEEANPRSEELSNKYDEYINTLLEMKETVDKLCKSQKKSLLLPAIMVDHAKNFIKKTKHLLNCTHTAIALKILEYEYNIKMSLEELLVKTKQNIVELETNVTKKRNETIVKLYEKNKQLIKFLRKSKTTMEIENIDKEIKKYVLKIKSEPCETEALHQLRLELDYWKGCLEEFKHIVGNIKRVKCEVMKVDKQIDAYNSVRGPDYKSTKKCCYAQVNEALAKNRQYIKAKYYETVKCLITYFSVRGNNQTFYKDDMGTFYKDPFGHQVYSHDYGLVEFHKKCDGDLIQYHDKYKFYRDEHGQYFKNDKGEKIYKVGYCCSSYRLCEEGTFVKISESCCHDILCCRLCEKKDEVIVPDEKPVNLKDALSKDDIDYLWKMAGIISMTLRDVATLQPKNPVHYFAHRLLENRGNKMDVKKEQEAADDFRENTTKAREQKLLAERKEWLSKQMKRSLPEESDDTQAQREYYDYMTQINLM